MIASVKKANRGYYSASVKGTRKKSDKRANLASMKVVHAIRNALFSDELKAGDFLGSESDLVDYFAVTRMPVRDALRTLEAMGVVDIRVGGNGGVYVAKGDPLIFAEALAVQHKLLGINYSEMIDIQIALESMAVELAIKNAHDDELVRIEQVVVKLAQHTGNKELFTDVAIEYHNAIADASGNSAIIAHMHVFTEMFFHYYIPATHLVNEAKGINTYSVVVKHHKKLARLLKERDTVAAHQLIRKHWNKMRQFFY